MTIALKTLPGGRGRLTANATASVARIDKQRHSQGLPPLHINSAYRSNAEQEALKKRWTQGGIFNRPPFLYKPAWYPPYPHGTGLFLDTSDIVWMRTYGAAHGWRSTVASDRVHFGYFISKDRERPVAPKDPNPKRQVYRLAGTGPARYYLVGVGKRWNTRSYLLAKQWIKNYGYGGILPLTEIVARETALRAIFPA